MPHTARVLVVSGDKKARERLGATLSARGYDSLTSGSLEDARKQVQTSRPDIAIVYADGQKVTAEAASKFAAFIKRPDTVLQYPVILIGDDTVTWPDVEVRLTQPFHDMQLFSRIESIIRLETMGRELNRRRKTMARFGAEDTQPVYPPTQFENVMILVVGAASADFSEIETVLADEHTMLVGTFTQATGLEYLNGGNFDVVILNVNSDAVKLLQFCEQMRRNPRFYNTPVLVLADLKELGPPEEVYRDGASDIITKPIHANELQRRVGALVRETRLRDTMREVFATGPCALTSDTLTRLYTYGFFQEHLRCVVDDSWHINQDLTVAFFNLENMAGINTQFGYAVGDRLISQIGSMLGLLVRGEDIPARYEGADFALALPNTSEEAAQFVIRRIAGVVNSTSFASNEEDFPIMVRLKIGYASLQSCGTAESLLHKAREQAKTAN